MAYLRFKYILGRHIHIFGFGWYSKTTVHLFQIECSRLFKLSSVKCEYFYASLLLMLTAPYPPLNATLLSTKPSCML